MLHVTQKLNLLNVLIIAFESNETPNLSHGTYRMQFVA